MSVRLRAALAAAILALAAAPAAEAAQKRKTKLGDFKMLSFKVSKRTVQAGDTVRASGKVRNRKGRKAQTARVTYTLRRSRKARRGTRLGGDNIKRTRARRSRKFSERLRIPARTTARAYYLTACVRRGSGTMRAECKRRKLTVTAIPGVPAPPPPPPPGPAPDNRTVGQKLADAVNAGNMRSHLEAFQAIADANGGNRASGFPGYDASVQYVVDQLESNGFDAVTQEFTFPTWEEDPEGHEFEQLTPNATTYTVGEDFNALEYSEQGDAEGTVQEVTPNLAGNRANDDGCQDADFAGKTYTGRIALIQRGTCTFYEKAINAQEKGAIGVIFFNQGDDPGPGRSGPISGVTMGGDGQNGDPSDGELLIPVIGTSFAIGEELVSGDPTARFVVDATNTLNTTRNVLAETPGGDADNVVQLGAHLDSVNEGAGINDNGTGSAYVLEMALQMNRLGITPANKVRFSWWGAEEASLIGSTFYVDNLSESDLDRIRQYHNFDMIGSTNFVRHIFDGDFSTFPGPLSAPDVNEGAAELERTYQAHFDARGLPHEPTEFDGRSDYKAFQDEGIPSGGLFTGADDIKTREQVRRFGGIPAQQLDPNYHSEHDTIENVHFGVYEEMANAAAEVIGDYAADASVRDRFARQDPDPNARVRQKAAPDRVGDSLLR